MDDNGFFGATSTIVTSASSKTSIALAHQLHARAAGPVIGLTSQRNCAFVESLGSYDRVLLYDDVESIPAGDASVLVDMAGNGEVTGRVHRHLGKSLAYSCAVGATHWQAGACPAELPGPPPEFFFAPGQIEKRSKQWGPGELQRRIAADWSGFAEASDAWLHVVRSEGEAEVERVYQAILAGRHEPRDGHILSLRARD